MKKILLCEDEATFRTALHAVLTEEGFEVTDAVDGRAAQDILKLKKPFDLVISDIRMPRLNGIELLHWIKRTQPIPVILMTGFSELMETQEAHSLGADGFLPKPFGVADLRATIQALLPDDPTAPKPKPDLDELYCKIGIDDFISGSTIPYPIYVRLSATNYVMLAQKGEDLSNERISSYKSRNVHFLYLERRDFRKYVGMNLNLAHAMIATRHNIPLERKQRFLKHAGEMMVQKVFVDGIREEDFEAARIFMEGTLAVMSEQDEHMVLLEILANESEYLFSHSLAVGIFSGLIAKKMTYQSAQTMFRLTMGGLLHDIGLKEARQKSD